MYQEENSIKYFITRRDIEEMIKVCYGEELHRKKEAEYNQQIGKERIELV